MPIIPATLEVEIKRTIVQVQQEKKLARPYLNKLNRCSCTKYNPSYSGGIGRKIAVQGHPRPKV
jgi:hypothetical protein